MKREYPSLSDTCLEKLFLWKRLEDGIITSSELMRLSFLSALITAEQYADYQEIEKMSELCDGRLPRQACD